ncbi:DUF2147 domain-containing protein [Acinetobacter brisouii]
MWKLPLILTLSACSSLSFATDIRGTWKQIDDKTGSPKAVIQIRQEKDGNYIGKIIKVTPRPGYVPKETCINCPAPYNNKPILGLDIIHDLKSIGNDSYGGGKILDPLTGKIYSVKGKLLSNGRLLQLRGYLGISTLGRTQVWIREN